MGALLNSKALATALIVSIPCSPAVASSCAGSAASVTGLNEYVARVFGFGVTAAGITALAVVVFGAVQYTVSVGSPSGQSDARDRITQAILGLILIFGAFLILKTINPAIVSLKAPVITAINNVSTGGSNISF